MAIEWRWSTRSGSSSIFARSTTSYHSSAARGSWPNARFSSTARRTTDHTSSHFSCICVIQKLQSFI